ncbi:MAG: UvrD-helicase domain-containing protein [Phycisphaerae bacterium]|nr:UvrD-helicase domain-containing protein [Phycisphaerae bacterium]
MSDARQQILENLTDAQRAAVRHIDGPLLVLAGAGSGKTRVITRRVAWLMANGVSGGAILAVTFTNKAANEMKHRIDTLLVEQGDDGWGARPTVATFHSFAARIMRIHHERFSLPQDFSIYDQSDRLRAIKLAIERAGLSPDNFQPGDIEQTISREKNQLRSAAEFSAKATNFIDHRTAQIFVAYEKVLEEAKALDFDDLLFRLARMLRDNDAFRREMNDRYRYILIDEYQDTNAAQYQIARDLAKPVNNICATGDPDQSIYGWRGANLDNILQFERDFPGAKVVRLEQNYRSTKRILAAADKLIQNNVRRKHKGLWTENAEGDKIAAICCESPEAEAQLVADRVEKAFAAGIGYNQMAVFMRLNALTRVLEEAFRRRRIPYQIARGLSFYNRKEIKDATSYLKLMVNPADRVALERVINTPPRGIGQTTVDRLVEFATAENLELWAAVRIACGAEPATLTLPALGRSAAAVKKFVELFDRMTAEAKEAGGVRRAMEIVLRLSGLQELYKEDESASANLGELLTAAEQFDEDTDFQGTLGDWLQEVALVSDVDSVDEQLGAVTMMTLHAAKGLEFPAVFIVGCKRGIIPHERDNRVVDEEEERRLLFVGITRAMRQLTLTHVVQRMLHGKTMQQLPSPFLAELPDEVVEREDLTGGASAGGTFQPGWSRPNRWPMPGAGRGASAGGGSYGGGWRKRRESDDGVDSGGSQFDAPSRQFAREDAEALRQAEQESTQERTGWPIGTLVRHAKFGVGKVVKVTPSGPYTKATIDFRTAGLKAVIMEMAPIERMLG